MKTFQLLPMHTVLLLTLFSALLITACGDNPAGGDDDEHADPHGLELVHNGQVILEYTEGEGVTEHTQRHYLVGEEYLFEVHFLDEKGGHVHDEDLGEEYSLGWDIENNNVLAIEQHEEDGRWSFYLEGLEEGGSKVQFKLMHGDDHGDFQTFPVEHENAIEFHIDAVDTGEHEH
ncbi:hypothetical protein SAMN05443144_101265 [Fodinibius roseus]|uniref:Uncharacterized protein n=1 Tax=Fodinibius roseus TaxID=1194090 RepID=A0A1M4TCR9_9BACT|nr:hypothetical protein [Fodinibius roseus]SHE42302.1 hypothetical protein SAMN05443144_101265 [Fodinibius roseus]